MNQVRLANAPGLNKIIIVINIYQQKKMRLQFKKRERVE